MSVKDRIKLIAELKSHRDEATKLLQEIETQKTRVVGLINRINQTITEVDDLDKTPEKGE